MLNYQDRPDEALKRAANVRRHVHRWRAELLALGPMPRRPVDVHAYQWERACAPWLHRRQAILGAVELIDDLEREGGLIFRIGA